LHRAAEKGRSGNLSILLGENDDDDDGGGRKLKGMVDVNVVDASKELALHKAIRGNHVACVEVLLRRRAATKNKEAPLPALFQANDDGLTAQAMAAVMAKEVRNRLPPELATETINILTEVGGDDTKYALPLDLTKVCSSYICPGITYFNRPSRGLLH
jgi:hypothetical protein